MRGDTGLRGEGHSVRLENVAKKFGDFFAVDHINIETSPGEFLTMLGPSGSGKTTTLKIISGLEFPTEGQVYIDEKPVIHKPAYQRDLGMVFQNYALFPHMTTFENIAFPMKMRGIPKNEILKKVYTILDLVQLSGLQERHPKQLSGGQQQRVALARALVYEPSVLLMDEPLGALDKKLREEMQLEVKQIQRRLKITTIYVTHDQSEALTMSDRIALMNHGKIEQLGTPEEIYERPANKFVAQFIGESNFIEGVITRIEKEWCEGRTSTGLTVRGKAKPGTSEGQKVNLTIRPERIRIQAKPGQIDNLFYGTIKEAVYLGETIKYVIVLEGGEELVVKSQNMESGILEETGKRISIGWSREHCLIV
jgi:putative spermidine/putrescine transport system ATP-binding protein